MRKKSAITILVLLAGKFSFAQYKGGSNDGFTNAFFSRQNITDNTAFKGGSNDGFAGILMNKQDIKDSLAFKGGNNDGFATAFFNKQNIKDSLAFKGGSNDGFIAANFNKLNIKDSLAFKGGNNDGFAVALFTRQTLTDTVFRGGNGRGETQVFVLRGICGQPGAASVWNGSTSNVWANPNNWDCGNVPGINSVVIIPAGLSRYPVVFANAECKSLQLQPGSSVTVPAGILLKLNGQ